MMGSNKDSGDNDLERKNSEVSHQNKIKALSLTKNQPTEGLSGDDLIQVLKTRIELLEMKLSESIDFQNTEAEEKAEFKARFEDKADELKNYQKHEERTIKNKVEKELKKFVELTSVKVIAIEKERDGYKNILNEKNYLLQELDGMCIGFKKALFDGDNKAKMQDEITNALKIQTKQLEKELSLKTGEAKEKDARLTKCNNDYEGLKNGIQKLGDVRNVINRVWNEEQDDNRVIEKLKSEDMLSPMNRGGDGQPMQSYKSQPNQITHNHNKSFRNSAGDSFWYSDQKGDYRGTKLDPIPNQAQNALRDPGYNQGSINQSNMQNSAFGNQQHQYSGGFKGNSQLGVPRSGNNDRNQGNATNYYN